MMTSKNCHWPYEMSVQTLPTGVQTKGKINLINEFKMYFYIIYISKLEWRILPAPKTTSHPNSGIIFFQRSCLC